MTRAGLKGETIDDELLLFVCEERCRLGIVRKKPPDKERHDDGNKAFENEDPVPTIKSGDARKDPRSVTIAR
jgi:hypothetical protein